MIIYGVILLAIFSCILWASHRFTVMAERIKKWEKANQKVPDENVSNNNSWLDE